MIRRLQRFAIDCQQHISGPDARCPRGTRIGHLGDYETTGHQRIIDNQAQPAARRPRRCRLRRRGLVCRRRCSCRSRLRFRFANASCGGRRSRIDGNRCRSIIRCCPASVPTVSAGSLLCRRLGCRERNLERLGNGDVSGGEPVTVSGDDSLRGQRRYGGCHGEQEAALRRKRQVRRHRSTTNGRFRVGVDKGCRFGKHHGNLCCPEAV